jgi:probable phosphoglycerate mutase
MPTIFLIRHGDNDYLQNNRLPGHLPGIHLNQNGLAQADELAGSLACFSFNAIYSSPLERAIETATPLAKIKRMGIQIIPDLTDIDVGDWAGRSWKSQRRTQAWKTIQNEPSRFRFPAGETFVEAQQRICLAIQGLSAVHNRNNKIAVFFHADPIKLALAKYLGLPLDNFQRLSVQTGSISILKVNRDSTRVLGINLIPPCSFPDLDDD